MKRFTETTKWKDPWFRRLTPEMKIFWGFLVDVVDNAGVWEPDMDYASFVIGTDLKEDEVLNVFNVGKERIEVLANNKWYLSQFIMFQYGELNPRCYPHQKVRELVIRHGLESRVGIRVGGTTKVTTLKEEDKDIKTFIKQLTEYWNTTELQGIQTISKEREKKLRLRYSNGHFRKEWNNAIAKMAGSAFCLGRSKSSAWKATIDWFIRDDTNYLKALEGKYDDNENQSDKFSYVNNK